MKNIAALVCMGFALIISVNCSICQSCTNRNGKTCTSESVQCEGASGCSTIAGFVRYGNKSFPFIHKGCPTDVLCGEWLCVTSDLFDCQSFIQCCSGDDCNPEYYIPEDREKANGYICSYCYEEENVGGCKQETQVACRGNDTLCVEYRGIIRKPDGTKHGTSFKSCANTLGFQNFNAFYGIQEIRRIKFDLIPPIAGGTK
ncbi:uncharacterized protein [Engystomops pustulosus]|uniref:uncharacterized protein n=1 Tax=Engystomops pustulosus TaxID=76066 RepID=UPI003AFAAC0D